MIIPKHLFGPYAGAKSREAPTNLKPVGTGPYKFVDFKPGDIVRGEINKTYHMPNRPFFDTIEMKGGGDATSAARAVLQTGEYDYAWNLQVEDEVLKRMEAGGKGKVHVVPSGDIEFIQLNPTDPWTEVDGERGSLKSKHFAFTDPKVREAMALLVRQEEHAGVHLRPHRRGHRQLHEQPVALPLAEHEVGVQHRQGQCAARRRRLEEGWRRRAREGRQEDEVRLPDVHQRHPAEGAGDRQAGRAEGRHRPRAEVGDGLGVLLVRRRQSRHLRQVLVRHADVHHDHDRARRRALHGPVQVGRGSQKANKWQGRNIARYVNPEYDKLAAAASSELDPVKRAAMYIKMNDMVVNDYVVIPLISRPRVRGGNLKLVTTLSGWDLDFSALQNWYREGGVG